MKIDIVSSHVMFHRADRYMNIKQFFGIGEPYLTIHKDGRTQILTNTGVMLIMNNEKTVLITCYVATKSQAVRIYRDVYGQQKMPQWLFNRVMKNQKLVEEMKKDGMII